MNRPNAAPLAVWGLAAGFSIGCGAPPVDSGATSARESLQPFQLLIDWQVEPTYLAGRSNELEGRPVVSQTLKHPSTSGGRFETRGFDTIFPSCNNREDYRLLVGVSSPAPQGPVDVEDGPSPGTADRETVFGGTHPPLMLEHGRYPWIPPEIGRPDGRNHTGEGSGVSRGRGRSTSKLAGDQWGGEMTRRCDPPDVAEFHETGPRRHSSTRCAGFPDGFGGVGLHHQGPVCWPAADARPANSRTCPPIRPPKVTRHTGGSMDRLPRRHGRHGRRSQARRQLLPRCRWRSPRPGSRTSTPTSAASRAAHAASPPR